MLVAGLTYQGLGMFLALMMYPLYFGRLLTSVRAHSRFEIQVSVQGLTHIRVFQLTLQEQQ
jgi:hypothetical protein